MDHHLVAEVSVAGISLDVLGSLYLAYDLLGGEHGPLRLLTRMVTYSIVFGIGYSIGLGLFFGIATGAATGITVAIELQRASRDPKARFPPVAEACFSAVRSFGFAVGLYRMVGTSFALAFATAIFAGQIVAYSFGMRPSLDYESSRRLRLTRTQTIGAAIRTAGFIVTALACSYFVRHLDHALLFSLRIGLVTGIVTTIGTWVNPFIEYSADTLPARRMGVLGVCLLLFGFLFQSFQYWATILDLPIS